MADDIVKRLSVMKFGDEIMLRDEATIHDAADLLQAIDALHQRGGPKNWPICAYCRESWPCPTARLLHPEEVDRG